MPLAQTTCRARRRIVRGDFESTIAGIPCRIDITHYSSKAGEFSHSSASDWDYHGYEECEFDVLDRKGYKATWLEHKMSAVDKARIEAEISEHKQEAACDY